MCVSTLARCMAEHAVNGMARAGHARTGSPEGRLTFPIFPSGPARKP